MPTPDVEPSEPRPQCPSLACGMSSCLHGSPAGDEMLLTHGVDAARHVVPETPLVLSPPQRGGSATGDPPALPAYFLWVDPVMLTSAAPKAPTRAPSGRGFPLRAGGGGRGPRSA